MDAYVLTDREFRLFQEKIYELAGINLTPAKKALVAHRLSRRLRHYGLKTYQEYFTIINENLHPKEQQMMVDLLTTNETFFFREIEHFDYLRDKILPSWEPTQTFRMWSAACSSGEEPYSAAMVIDSHKNVKTWEILASDLSTRVLEKAAQGVYPNERMQKIPTEYIKKYCLRGVRSNEGTFMIKKELRNNVRFQQINLNNPPKHLGSFDVIFLRNVLIYFDQPTKKQFVNNLIPYLKKGGHFLCGHAESLQGISTELSSVKPATYIKK